MNQHPERIKRPFDTPEGYLEGFEDRLMNKINEKQAEKPVLVVHRNRGIIQRYWAVAAAFLLAVALAWLFWPVADKPAPEVVVSPVKTPVMDQPDTASVVSPALTEEKLIEQLTETSETDPVPVPAPALSTEDELIAMELEEAGLIVDEIDDGLFDEIEIQP